MSYIIQANAPQITTQGRTFAIGCIQFGALVTLDAIAVFEKLSDGWNEVGAFILDISPDQMLSFVAAKGGIEATKAWIKSGVNVVLSGIFAPTAPPLTGEPTTDAEALKMLQDAINTWILTVVNGQLVAS